MKRTNQERYKMQSNAIQVMKDTTMNGTVFYTGCIVTKYGVVAAMSQGFEGDTTKFSRLDFSHEGFHHIKSFHGEALSRRALSRRANVFAREVLNGEGLRNE